ncbi:hypothetical protein AB4Z32_24765 [Massilia sp. 2TAF26]|uniref:hypothetical protein n=1 Tax=Massilia sp. 2TAF26 TaxID=3233012 RepID=UPI003F9BFE21
MAEQDVSSPNNNPDLTLEDQRKKIEAETLLNNAKKSLSDSQKSLAAALVSPSASKISNDEELARLTSELNLTKAKSDKTAAELELAKSKIGNIPDGPFTGTVTLGEKSGNAEAALLAAVAIKQIATRIVTHMDAAYAERTQRATPRNIIIMSTADIPSFSAVQNFRIQKSVIEQAYKDSEKKAEDADERAAPPATPEFVAPQTIGLALDATNKLLNFFRTDYSIKGVDITVEDLMLVNALGGEITNTRKTKYQVTLPTTFNGNALATAGSSVISVFFGLAQKRDECVARSARHSRTADFYVAESKKPEKNEPDRTIDAERANVQKAAADQWKSTATLIDAFLTKITTPDEKGIIPLSALTKENSIADALSKDTDILIVKIHNANGSLYTKKNLLTALGKMPFFIMGSAVASFSLFDGRDGRLLSADLIPIHGGYTSVQDVKNTVEINESQEHQNDTKQNAADN